MTTTEPTDYPAELERIARHLMRLANGGDEMSAVDGRILSEAAALIRRQAPEIAELRGLVSQVEFPYPPGGNDECSEMQCFLCGRTESQGHKARCRIKAALGA
jgi:hypothetical protein